MKCKLCKTDIESDGNFDEYKICDKCAEKVAMSFSDIVEGMDVFIRASYDIVELKEHPVLDCLCDYHTVVAYDYGTVSADDGKYDIFLECMCRGCGGRKQVRLNKLRTNFPIKTINKPLLLKHENESIEKVNCSDIFI